MSTPIPSYPELGKLARDLLKRGYHPGIWQVETKTLTSSGIELFSTGYETHDQLKVNGTLQSKYKMEDQGLTLTEGWNTDRWLFGEITQKDKLSEGLTLGLAGRYQPTFNEIDGKFKVDYAQEKYRVLGELGLSRYPVLGASVVMAYEAYLGGVGLEFDITNVYMRGMKLALGWTNEQATVHAEVKSGRAWLASLFYKVDDKCDVAAEVARSAIISTTTTNETGENPEAPQESRVVITGGDVTVSLGMIYRLDENALVRAKINSGMELGLGYEQKMGEGITASISTILDFGTFSTGHKFGVGVAFQC